MALTSKQEIVLKREIDDSYPIFFGRDLFAQIAEDADSNRKYAIISDSNVAPLYAGKLEQALSLRDINCQVIYFPAGEQSKSWEMIGKLNGALADSKLDRDSVLIALGGGVVGDMTGFAAGTFLRGVDYIQVPTTLLAQVDSSIGGKTGVDLPQGKNLAGAFKHPKKVYIDYSTLNTLHINEMRNGSAEVIKYGIIRGSELFGRLEKDIDKLLGRDSEFLSYVVETCCGIKRDVVQQDPEEKSLRSILNGGHTLGHAAEKLSNYQLPHGACVAMGLVAMGRIAIAKKTGFTGEDLERVLALLERAGLPTVFPAYMSAKNLIAAAANDKKAKVDPATGLKEAKYTLPNCIGEMCDYGCKWKTKVELEIVNRAIGETR